MGSHCIKVVVGSETSWLLPARWFGKKRPQLPANQQHVAVDASCVRQARQEELHGAVLEHNIYAGRIDAEGCDGHVLLQADQVIVQWGVGALQDAHGRCRGD